MKMSDIVCGYFRMLLQPFIKRFLFAPVWITFEAKSSIKNENGSILQVVSNKV